LIVALVVGAATARGLGAAGKGTLATITFIGGVGSLAAGLGLGDAAMVWTNRRGFGLGELTPGLIAGVLIGSLAVAPLVAVACLFAVGTKPEGAALAIGVVAAGVPITAMWTLLSSTIYAMHRFTIVNFALVLTASVTLVGTITLLNLLGLGLPGAAAAPAIGTATGATVAVLFLRQRAVPLRPRLDVGLIRSVISFGLRAQLSASMTLLVGRADVLVTYLLASHAAAGRYSVALTVASVVGIAPVALMAVMFPQVAATAEPAVPEFVARLARVATTAGLAVALCLAAVSPVVVPLVFGRSFTGSVAAVEILLPGFVLASAQWSLGRSAVSQGHPSLLLASWAANLTVMIGLDFALIPALGIVGGAVASSAGSAIGAFVTVAFHPSMGAASRAKFAGMCLPRPDDVRQVIAGVRALVRRPARAAATDD
jgi:O-antigen/teichoic acid export membrane protein